MNGYFLLVTVVLTSSVLAFLSQFFSEKKRDSLASKILFGLSFLVLLVFLGFRTSGIGIDDYNYGQMLNYVRADGPFETFSHLGVEPGYLLLNSVVGMFTNDYQVIIFIMAFLSLMFFYLRLRDFRNEISIFIAIILFGFTVYPYFFGILRLSLAMSIVFFATRYIEIGNRKRYNLFIILASSIHLSAAIMLLYNLIFKKKLIKRNIIKYYIFLAIAIPTILLIITCFIAPNMGDRYSLYTSMGEFSLSIADLDKLPFIIFGLFFYKNTIKNSKFFSLHFFLYSISVIIAMCSSIFNLGRLEWYFSIFICLFLPELIKNIWANKKIHFLNFIFIPLIIVYGLLYSNLLVSKDSKIVSIDEYQNVLMHRE